MCDPLKIPGTSMFFFVNSWYSSSVCLLIFSVCFRGFEVSYNKNFVALCLYKCLIFCWRKEIKKILDKQSCSFYNEPWHNMPKVFRRLTISFKYAWFLDIFSLIILICFMLTKRQVCSLLILQKFFTSGQYAFWSNLSLTLQAEKCKI